MYIPNEKMKLNRFKKVKPVSVKDLYIRGINPEAYKVPGQAYNEGEYTPNMNKTEMLAFAQEMVSESAEAAAQEDMPEGDDENG